GLAGGAARAAVDPEVRLPAARLADDVGELAARWTAGPKPGDRLGLNVGQAHDNRAVTGALRVVQRRSTRLGRMPGPGRDEARLRAIPSHQIPHDLARLALWKRRRTERRLAEQDPEHLRLAIRPEQPQVV